VLVDLAEQAAGVVVAVGGIRCTGRIVGVARDFCVLQPASGRPTLIALGAISALWPQQPGGRGAAGDRRPGLTLSMAGALSALAEERSRVVLSLADGGQVEGEMVAVGEDVATLRTEPPSRRSVYVRLAAVTCCEVR